MGSLAKTTGPISTTLDAKNSLVKGFYLQILNIQFLNRNTFLYANQPYAIIIDLHKYLQWFFVEIFEIGILDIIVFPIIFSLYMCYYMAYCTAIRVMFTPCPNPGENPGPLDCKSVTVPSELRWPLNVPAVKDVHNLIMCLTV